MLSLNLKANTDDFFYYGGHLYTAYPALALSGLQSIITLVFHVCVHLFNGQATYYTINYTI